MFYLAHRGSCKNHPENSIASIKHALKRGFDGIEFDVRMSKDKAIYLLHDSKLNRTTNMKGRLSKKTSNELRRCRLHNGEKLPTLDAALKAIRKRALIYVELKEPGCEKEVLHKVRRYDLESNVVISSFKKKILLKTRKLNKRIKLDMESAIFLSSHAKLAKKLNCYSVGCRLWFLSRNQRDHLRTNNILIIPYGIKMDMTRRFALWCGADGLCVKHK